jgi:hypothetical protein
MPFAGTFAPALVGEMKGFSIDFVWVKKQGGFLGIALSQPLPLAAAGA